MNNDRMNSFLYSIHTHTHTHIARRRSEWLDIATIVGHLTGEEGRVNVVKVTPPSSDTRITSVYSREYTLYMLKNINDYITHCT